MLHCFSQRLQSIGVGLLASVLAFGNRLLYKSTGLVIANILLTVELEY